MNTISEYYSEESERCALVYKDKQQYFVRLIENENTVVKYFLTLEECQICAEDWVLGDNYE